MSKYTVNTWDAHIAQSEQLKTKDEVISHLMWLISEISETDIEIEYPAKGTISYAGWGHKE